MRDERLYRLVEWIQETAGAAKGLLIPISGGSDGALCFWLCAQAFPERAYGVYVGRNLRARSWFESVGRVQTVASLPDGDNPEVLRWALFLSLSLKSQHWLVGTRNRTEDMLGTFSLASRAATYLPIAGLWKSEVLDLCQSAGVPEEVMASSRRADPECGRPPELAAISITSLDLFLQAKCEGVSTDASGTLDRNQVQYLEHVYQENLFKRTLPVRGPVSF